MALVELEQIAVQLCNLWLVVTSKHSELHLVGNVQLSDRQPLELPPVAAQSVAGVADKLS